MPDQAPRRRYSTITITIPGELTTPDQAARLFNSLDYAMKRAGHPANRIELPPVYVTAPRGPGYDGITLHREPQFGSTRKSCHFLDLDRKDLTWGSPRQLLKGLESMPDFPFVCPACHPFGHKAEAALGKEDAYKIGIVRTYFRAEGWITDED